MHLWIIMDGNRRWAKNQWKLSFFWHTAGFNNIEKITQLVSDRKIGYLTFWALSKENLQKRDVDEIAWLIQLIDKTINFLPKFHKNNIRFETIWDISRLPQKTQDILSNMSEETKNNSWMVVTIALVYSGQDEIVRATQKMLQDWVDPQTLDEKNFRSYLDTSKLPEIDLIIRTGWDARHSGFLLYDSAYSEYYFTDKYWPEFDEQELDKALALYNNSERRFGK